MKSCFCGSPKPFSKCCSPIIKGTASAASAEELMRSRYSAYVVGDADYIIASTHVSERGSLVKDEVADWARSNIWKQLEIIKADASTVEFKAHFRNRNGKLQVHHEKSTFVYQEGKWFYKDGVFDDDINNS
jgi:SEC-C motif-containing protein